ncbi:hypothetical protein B0H11DRAFT_190499 [Mycena galericulata]|nr:hypothetical protein B0H11DRAFT_190499 [Mycena galericulata]
MRLNMHVDCWSWSDLFDLCKRNVGYLGTYTWSSPCPTKWYPKISSTSFQSIPNALSFGLLSPTLLGQLCCRWRETVLSTPKLWRSIASSRSKEQTRKQNNHFLETSLERSASCPLAVVEMPPRRRSCICAETGLMYSDTCISLGSFGTYLCLW